MVKPELDTRFNCRLQSRSGCQGSLPALEGGLHIEAVDTTSLRAAAQGAWMRERAVVGWRCL
jgi:hypothetical protein